MDKTLADVKQAVADLLAHVDSEATEVNGLLTTANNRIKELQDQIAAGTPATAADLGDLFDQITAATARVDGIVPNAPEVPVPDPATGGDTGTGDGSQQT